MNKLAILAAAALSAATFGAAAIAQDSNNFESADANKDGFVSWDEALGAYPTLTQEIFNQADGNTDGNLDEAEFTALQGLTASVDDSTDAAGQTLPAEPVSSESSSAQ